jgi:NTP pyrophosphatase (non-canonical NTP hydrolase)
MQEMQKALQEKYKQKWEPICPATGQNKLLWMIGEVGEVIDIVKKNGAADAVEKEDLRKHLVEEMADVLMYYNDVMLCYGITAEELKAAVNDCVQMEEDVKTGKISDLLSVELLITKYSRAA